MFSKCISTVEKLKDFIREILMPHFSLSPRCYPEATVLASPPYYQSRLPRELPLLPLRLGKQGSLVIAVETEGDLVSKPRLHLAYEDIAACCFILYSLDFVHKP
jgi:hypothetical protein